MNAFNPGFATLLNNLIMSSQLPNAETTVEVGPWLYEYMKGAQQELYVVIIIIIYIYIEWNIR